MKKIPAILFFILLSLMAASQRTIKGRVINGETGTAISGSSVFITNTSKGTVTNSVGSFELNDVPPGKHDLIISCIGYETNVFSFSDEQLPLQLKVEMAIKVRELENVTLEPSVEEGWDKWGKTFMDNFVGNTANSLQCRIKNEKAIRFRFYKKSNRLIAYADEPVLLENKALGYLIKYQLENFEVNFKENSVFFLGYPLFEDLRSQSRIKWEKKRLEAYYGSIMHFMRSLYTDSLLAEGFEVTRMSRLPNYEKQRVKKFFKPTGSFKATTREGSFVINISDTVKNTASDSSAYFSSVMRQPDYIEKYGKDLLTADSLIADGPTGSKLLLFDNYLYVIYRNQLEEEAYLKTQFPQRKPSFQRSFVTLKGDKIITLDKEGNYYNPLDFFTSGYWGWGEKMANSLPFEYNGRK